MQCNPTAFQAEVFAKELGAREIINLLPANKDIKILYGSQVALKDLNSNEPGSKLSRN